MVYVYDVKSAYVGQVIDPRYLLPVRELVTVVLDCICNVYK
jgi:hypothetical protein